MLIVKLPLTRKISAHSGLPTYTQLQKHLHWLQLHNSSHKEFFALSCHCVTSTLHVANVASSDDDITIRYDDITHGNNDITRGNDNIVHIIWSVLIE